MYIICYMSQHVLYCKYRRRHFYVICHNMHYIVSNGEDISKLNDNCRIHLLFYYNKICFNENILFFDVCLFSQHSFIWLKGYANPEKTNARTKTEGCGPVLVATVYDLKQKRFSRTHNIVFTSDIVYCMKCWLSHVNNFMGPNW